MRHTFRLALLPCFLVAAGCASEITDDADDTGTGGMGPGHSGGSTSNSTGGSTYSGGGFGTGGAVSSGGALSGGGGQAATGGGFTGSGGGFQGAGGAPIFGSGGRFGDGSGGRMGAGGAPDGGSGGAESGGAPGVGGSPAGTGGGDPTAEPDCNAQLPASGEEHHTGNGVGGEGNLAWEIWSNTQQGDLVTYGDVPAFSAVWNEAGGYLGRMGFEWGGWMSTPLPYEEYGTITAQFVSKKSGTAGQYSYVGMYGWSNDPCIEWYVVEDSFNNMPINPGMTTNQGEVEIDGGTYIMYTRPTTGTGGSRCEGVNNWNQYYSVRKTARACGVISLTEHFDAWKSLNMPMGVLLEAKIIAEVGGGSGRVDFPVANVTTTQ